jgi:hypothetical protein
MPLGIVHRPISYQSISSKNHLTSYKKNTSPPNTTSIKILTPTKGCDMLRPAAELLEEEEEDDDDVAFADPAVVVVLPTVKLSTVASSASHSSQAV